MNIFMTSKCPIESAWYLDDKRVVKMVLESTQLLCTALNLNGIKTPYKSTHSNHPCTKWVMESNQNWRWVHDHAVALCAEYRKRYDKTHACLKVLDEIKNMGVHLPDAGLTEFEGCTGKYDNTNLPITLKYKMLLSDKWNEDKREPTWYGVHYEKSLETNIKYETKDRDGICPYCNSTRIYDIPKGEVDSHMDYECLDCGNMGIY